jgi:hypothetical protein
MKFNYIKGTEKDFDGAPDSVVVIAAVKNYKPENKFWFESAGIALSYDNEIIAHREPITETLSWYEKGELPPSGTICEVRISDEWFASEIIGISSGGSIIFTVPFGKFNRLYDSFDAGAIKNNKSTRFFRPLKSKQEKEKDELVAALSCAWRESSGIADLSKMAQKLYDLGYRKIEGEKK